MTKLRLEMIKHDRPISHMVKFPSVVYRGPDCGYRASGSRLLKASRQVSSS